MCGRESSWEQSANKGVTNSTSTHITRCAPPWPGCHRECCSRGAFVSQAHCESSACVTGPVRLSLGVWFAPCGPGLFPPRCTYGRGAFRCLEGPGSGVKFGGAQLPRPGCWSFRAGDLWGTILLPEAPHKGLAESSLHDCLLSLKMETTVSPHRASSRSLPHSMFPGGIFSSELGNSGEKNISPLCWMVKWLLALIILLVTTIDRSPVLLGVRDLILITLMMALESEIINGDKLWHTDRMKWAPATYLYRSW